MSQRSNVEPFSPAPIREYAEAAVAAARTDQRHGVAAWRIATHLYTQVRILLGRPTVEFSHVRLGEQEFYLDLARTSIALFESVDTTAPPTPAEILRHEQRQALSLARARARSEAHRRGHDLDGFRPSEPGYELACCRTCRAGVSIHLDTAGISMSRQLELPCKAAR